MTLEDMKNSLYHYRARCLRVVDGDTLDLEISLGLNTYVRERVRLFGINTPETYGVKKGSQEYLDGMAAKMAVFDLVVDRDLWVETVKDKTGKYGRYLARVYFEPELEPGTMICLNEWLVAEELAEVKIY